MYGDVKITKECYIMKDTVLRYTTYNTNAVVNDVRKKRKAGLLIDYTNGRKILTVIYLKDGTAIITNTGLETLHQRMVNAEKEMQYDLQE